MKIRATATILLALASTSASANSTNHFTQAFAEPPSALQLDQVTSNHDLELVNVLPVDGKYIAYFKPVSITDRTAGLNCRFTNLVGLEETDWFPNGPTAKDKKDRRNFFCERPKI